jgi:hypothetical protein
MALDQIARGMLETKVKDILQFKNDKDFLYGTVYGAITWGNMGQFRILFQRKTTEDEMLEIQTIVVKRMREVKDAIFKTG